MNYVAFSTETLKKTLKRHQSWLTWSRNLVSQQGGWILWDGDEEERIEKEVYQIQHELSNRDEKSL